MSKNNRSAKGIEVYLRVRPTKKPSPSIGKHPCQLNHSINNTLFILYLCKTNKSYCCKYST